MKASTILGLNARATLFSYRYNTARGRSVAASKLRTKKCFKKAGIPIPAIYAKFVRSEDVYAFNWDGLPESFALKPSKGLGGEGIIVVKKRDKNLGTWITTNKNKVTVDDLKLHTMDILEGAYSMGNVPDAAYIEEYVGRHSAFRKYAFRGTPDIRVIVFNKVPVMAMLRLPTKESGGRANLHQGAVGVGIDIATGITIRAIWHDEVIRFKPETKRKLHGIKIPGWTNILEIAVRAQEASGLGYVGVDIVLHPERGPMVLEINSQPGLSIQMANGVGLKKRLEKVEDLEIRDAEHGVKVAKALFASVFSSRVKAEEGIKTIDVFQEITIKTGDGRRVKSAAKIDTGAWRTSIDKNLAKSLGLLDENNILWRKKVKSSLGEENRLVINLTMWIGGRKVTTPASVAKRLSLKFPVIIGRKCLKGMVVNPVVDLEEKKRLMEKTYN